MKFFSIRHTLSLLFIVLITLGCSKEFQKDNLTDLLIGAVNGNAQIENPPAGARVIRDAYIVVFREDVVDVDQLTESLSKQGGFKARFAYKHSIKGFAATIPAQALAGIRNNPNVKYIEQDQEVRLEATQTGATWGLDRVDQSSLPLNGSYTYNSDGATVDAYIFDTGILTGHTEFDGTRAKFGYDAFGGNGLDSNGHGTHVAGTVGGTTYGVAKKINLVAVRILNNSGSGAWSGVIAGIDWAVGHHTSKPAVGNMSIGGGLNTAVNDAVKRAIADGIVMCVAAGNNYLANAGNYSPASTVEAITVGSSTNSDAISGFSNVGSVVDIFAPGSSITSSWYTSTTATNTISGTSMATPHVAGTAALYLEAFPGSSPSQVQQGLKNHAITGKITNVPAGTVNLLLHTNFVPTTNPPSEPVLTSPAINATSITTSPTFNWAAAANATSYILQISLVPEFTSPFIQQNTTGTTLSVSGLAQATLYYWRVIAKNSFGETSSVIRSFTTLLGVPTLLSPANNAKNVSRTPTLSWSSVIGADGYEYMISTSSTFAGATAVLQTGTSRQLSTLSAKTTYYWQVRAKKGTIFSSWSTRRSFITN